MFSSHFKEECALWIKCTNHPDSSCFGSSVQITPTLVALDQVYKSPATLVALDQVNKSPATLVALDQVYTSPPTLVDLSI